MLMPLDRELIALLACPVDRGAVREVGKELRCLLCDRHYSIRDGIPVMVADEADPRS
jgi:uncharacterized protein YbaR (Trm112 family)